MTDGPRLPSRPAWLRYGSGGLVVLVALAAAVALQTFDLEGFLFVIAVAVAVWIGGRGPGVLAVVLSVLALHYFFVAPSHTGAALPTYGYFVVFSVLAVLITALSEARHRAERSLMKARDDLEQRVAERTAELERTNQRLRDEIAERKRVEEDLRRNEAFLLEGQRDQRAAEAEIRKQAELLDLAHDAVIVRDDDSRIRFWNRGAEATYGWPAKEALGKISHELLRTRFPVSLDEIEKVAREHGRWEGELVHVRHDGATIVVASRWSVQRDERGRPIAFLEINRDITERKQAEEALRAAESELAHVTRVTTLGEVTASFAHEVNQPLAAIVNNANACLALLSDRSPDLGEVRAALSDIMGDANRASAIIERVRRLAMRSPSERASLELRDVVDDVVALTASESAARRVMIRCEVSEDLPVVSGDRVQLQQVLLNLVVNGMDAMASVPEPGRVLEIRGRRDTQDGRLAATISVQDHGVGLAGTEVGRIFDAFYTTKSHGMGMGLAISRSIIEAHGGRLWAESDPEPGATFCFRLPAAGSGSEG